MNLEQHFALFRNETIGSKSEIDTPFGTQPLVYCDWIASGRLYRPIEKRMVDELGPWVANTHSEASATGKAMTQAYHHGQKIIKDHVNAGPDDILISAGSGMTAVINKFQRILGLRSAASSSQARDLSCGLPQRQAGKDPNAPVVFITHMEHHSNHISWLETIAEVVVIEPDEHLQVDPQVLDNLLSRYAHRPLKLGSFSAASNVTGFIPPYRELARVMHRHGGYAFVDFAASAPYVDMDMHPSDDPEGYLDALFFSPHKFLGGPGSAGVLIFNKKLYHSSVPDNPGGGTVNWTNRWGERSYVTDIEAREDGGTPPFLQTIRTSLAIEVKNAMGVQAMALREKELLRTAVNGLQAIPGLIILGQGVPHDEQLGVLSFYTEQLHHNLIVALLNDRFGIQVRGGCSCAGTYGHWLLHVDRHDSTRISQEIDRGDLSHKPGWVRLSLHPTMGTDQLDYVIDAIGQTVKNGAVWGKDYRFNNGNGEFEYSGASWKTHDPQSWFRPFT